MRGLARSAFGVIVLGVSLGALAAPAFAQSELYEAGDFFESIDNRTLAARHRPFLSANPNGLDDVSRFVVAAADWQFSDFIAPHVAGSLAIFDQDERTFGWSAELGVELTLGPWRDPDYDGPFVAPVLFGSFFQVHGADPETERVVAKPGTWGVGAMLMAGWQTPQFAVFGFARVEHRFSSLQRTALEQLSGDEDRLALTLGVGFRASQDDDVLPRATIWFGYSITPGLTQGPWIAIDGRTLVYLLAEMIKDLPYALELAARSS